MVDQSASVRSSVLIVPLNVNKIEVNDLMDVLKKGLADFSAKPSLGIVICFIYPIAGVLILHLAMHQSLLYLLFPLAAGFTILGPFAATGVYEISRRREQGLDASWSHAFTITRSAFEPVVGCGVLFLSVFVSWISAADFIYFLTFGTAEPMSLWQFGHDVLTTRAGWLLIISGNVIGLMFAGLALAIGIVTFPLLIEQRVDLPTAMVTSARCVAKNPLVLFLWGLIVALALAAATLPFLLGLIIVVPVLGHATWHLYRKLLNSPAIQESQHTAFI